MSARKGLLLAGGTGTRLFPATLAVSKQLLPVYDKPMVFHPLCTLMAAGIRSIAIVTTPDDAPAFHRLLGDGAQWGIALTWLTQPRPEGLPQAYQLAEGFLDGAASAMILGDNLFHGARLAARMRAVPTSGATGWVTEVAHPERYGVVTFRDGRPNTLVEKPALPTSRWALTGLYHLDGSAPERARTLRPSARGELEITDLLRTWLDAGDLAIEHLDDGTTWLDTGTHDSLLEAGAFVRTVQRRSGRHVASPEEHAWRKGWIDAEDVLRAAERYGDGAYAHWLRRLVQVASVPPARQRPSDE